MAQYGIICEKPSQADKLAQALGGKSGTACGKSYVITAARGHLMQLVRDPGSQVKPELAERYRQWGIEYLPWDVADFEFKREPREGASALLRRIGDALEGCSDIVIACDCDPTYEGDLIGWEIIDRLRLASGRTVWRMTFSDDSLPELKRAFSELERRGPMRSDPAYRCAFFRDRWDWLSMMWTRAATDCGDHCSTLRQGRLKSAMVLLAGQQLDAVRAYVRKPFFQLRYRDENGVRYESADEPRFDSAGEVVVPPQTCAVVCDRRGERRTAPPKLIDLATLAARMAAEGVPAKRTSEIYQAMYEAHDEGGHGYVSYPRTEDTCVSVGQMEELAPLVGRIAEVAGVDARLLTHTQPRRTHTADGLAHGANRPGLAVPPSLEWLDEQFGRGAGRIYEMVARSYLAMLAEDYVYERQEGHLAERPEFKGAVNVPISAGWKAVDAESADKDDEEAALGLGTTAEPYVHEGANKKPSVPTMSWLMRQLKRRGIGSGATRTSTYAEVCDESQQFPLLKDTKGKISLTSYGEMSYLLLPDTHIGDLELTRHVQEEMAAVYDGTLDPDEALAEVARLVSEDVPVMQANGHTMRGRLGVPWANETAEVELAGERLTLRRMLAGHRLTDEELAQLERGGEATVLGLKNSRGEYGAVVRLERMDAGGVRVARCKVVRYLNADGTERAERAQGTWRGRQVSFKRAFAGHRFTDQEVAWLLAGETIAVAGEARDGSRQAYVGKLAEREYKGAKFVGFDLCGGLPTAGEMPAEEPPRTWAGHTFTAEETARLKSGEAVRARFTSKDGREWEDEVTFEREGDGRMRIVPSFAKGQGKGAGARGARRKGRR